MEKINLKQKFLQSLKIFFLAGVLFLGVSPLLSLAQTTAAPQTTAQRCAAFKNQFTLSTSTNGSVVNISNGYPSFCSATDLITSIIQYASAIAATVTILFLIIGGFMFITSAGNEEQSEKGKKILTNSIIGLVVIIMAYTIVRIVASLLSLGK